MSIAAPMLACQSVNRIIERTGQPDVELLKNVSFSVGKGQTLAVVGPSGAGKSTLLRLLNRLDEPTSGRVLLESKDTAHIDSRQLRRTVGMVMQRAFLFTGTVAENLRFGPAQIAEHLSDHQVDDLLEQVGLPGYRSRDARTVSGGEGQRVALARALANRPRVLLLDEPTSALDDAAKQGVEQLLLSIVRDQGLTCVWVTHDRAQARRVASEALALAGGRVLEYGSIDQVIDNQILGAQVMGA